MAVTPSGRDIYKSAVAADGAGRVWVAWAENTAYKAFPDNPPPSFDIFVSRFRSEDKEVRCADEAFRFTGERRLAGGGDGSDGRVWIAWQGARQSVFRIFERHQTKDGWSAARQVSTQTRNCWAPAIAATKGRVAMAWDTYEKGDYDVWVREFSGGTRRSAARGEHARL